MICPKTNCTHPQNRSNQMTQETDRGFAEDCMLAALKEVQDTVRAYDTKAQIVGVGFIFTIGVIVNIGSRLPDQPDLIP